MKKHLLATVFTLLSLPAWLKPQRKVAANLSARRQFTRTSYGQPYINNTQASARCTRLRLRAA